MIQMPSVWMRLEALTATVILVTWEMELLATAVSISWKRQFVQCLHLSYLDCMNGNVILKNGSEPVIGQREGRVEICYENIYHTICDDFWNLNDAQVVCRQLGAEGDGKGTCETTHL